MKLECEDCRRRSEEVSTRCFDHEYAADEYFDLCEKCYQKRSKTTATKADEPKDPTEILTPASKAEIRAMTQTAGLMLKTLRGLPRDQRITKLEELLAEKFVVAPGMEPAAEAYRVRLQAELDKLKELEGETVNVEYYLGEPSDKTKYFLNFVSNVPREVSLASIKPKAKQKVSFD